jgi:hypothetical protein
VSENRVLRRVSGPKGEEVAGGWRTLHLYTSPNIIRVIRSRRMRFSGHVACKGNMGNAFRILVRKPERKRQRGRPRHR